MTSTERRVLFIGDSFATRDAAECLQEALNAYGVSVGRSYNVSLAGYPGLGLEHFLPDVRDKVEKLSPIFSFTSIRTLTRTATIRG